MSSITYPGPSSSAAISNMSDNVESVIREVWASNLEEEFKIIRQVVQEYTYIAMDTEFPGTVAEPIEYRNPGEYQYQSLKFNIDQLKLIQLGLTFLDENGNPPPGISTWQFNFKFSIREDTHAENSIQFLIASGIQFERHEREGIDPFDFGEIVMVSGIVLTENIKMISFQGGYDFGYFLKLLLNRDLPEEESEFFVELNMYFPKIYDLKYIMKSCRNFRGGLQDLADRVNCRRIGVQHQAGSDSLLTGETFFRLREIFFDNYIDDERYCNNIYGPSVVMNCIYAERFWNTVPPNDVI